MGCKFFYKFKPGLFNSHTHFWNLGYFFDTFFTSLEKLHLSKSRIFAFSLCTGKYINLHENNFFLIWEYISVKPVYLNTPVVINTAGILQV